MDFSWDYLINGFMVALTWQNLLWALVGSLIGTLVGVLPGIGPSSGIAILLPLTTFLPPTSAIIMMAAIYYGAMYGGSTTAIVVNIPGEASSVPTAMDGYEMAKQGDAGPALAIAAISSFVAGTLSLVGLTFFAPLCAGFALSFGPPEYFALMLMGLSLVISLSGIKNLMPSWADIKRCTGAMLRSTGVGFFLGLLPGCAPSVTTFVAYDLEKRIAREPDRFGKGAIEGVAAPEGANNATSTAGFVPLFSFGLPTAPSMAVLLGGLMMYGLQPGPMLFKTNPQFVWAVIASMYIGNVMLLVLNLPLVGLWARIAVVPFPILAPIIVFCSVLGTYSIRFILFDVWVMLIFGLVGYFMRKFGFPIAPLVLASVLAQMLETSLQQSLLISQGSPFIFFTRPISLAFMILSAISIVWGLWGQMKKKEGTILVETDE